MRPRAFRTCGTLVLLGLASGCTNDTEPPSAPQPPTALFSTTTATAPLAFQQVSANDGGMNSARHTCGVTTDYQAYCWGDNHSGGLGTGTAEGRTTTPTPVTGRGHHLRQVSAGLNYTCGVTTNDALYCWGENSSGQLGDGTTTQRLRPTRVASRLRFREVSASWFHTCAITNDGIAYCWGANFYGLGDGTTTESRVPVRVAGGHHFQQVSAGFAHSCGVTTNNVGYCWGSNQFGQLGIGSGDQQRLRPAAIAGGIAFAEVKAGFEHTCGVTTGHQAYCWGLNSVELGSPPGGDIPYQLTPRAVDGGLAFRSVDAARSRTCGVTTTSVAYCWGRGILGNGTLDLGPSPVQVSGGLLFRQVDAGSAHTCGATEDGLAYCWGDNFFGELGDGTFIDRLTPVPVVGPSKPGSPNH